MKVNLARWAKMHPQLAAQAGLTGKEKATLSSQALKPGEAAELALYRSLNDLGIAHEPQYHWHPTRKWASDAAIPEQRLLIEIDGRAHIAGYERFTADMQRRRAATLMGWDILAFTPAEAEDGTAAATVQTWLEGRTA